MKRVGINFSTEPVLKASILGFITAWSVTILLSFISAIFIQSEYFDITSIPYISAIITFLAVLVSDILSLRIVKAHKIATCLITSVAYYISEICVALLFYEGVSVRALTGFIVCLLSSITAVLLCNMNNNQKKNRGKKRHAR